MADRQSTRLFSRGRGVLILGLSALLLAACAQQPDAEETIEQFTAVTEQPQIDDEFNVSANPNPIVDPVDCTHYLVITARGTGEPKRKGQLLSPVARAIADSRPGLVSVLDLEYPAADDVRVGSNAGARKLIDTLNVQTSVCATQQFILLGYSQGALVIGDALVSPEARLVGEHVGVVSAEAASRILAIVLYGNPRFVADEPYSVGTFTPSHDGILPRQAGSLAEFAERMRDYCVEGDFICQSTLEVDPEKHMDYYRNGMQNDGAAFVINRLEPISQASDLQAESPAND